MKRSNIDRTISTDQLLAIASAIEPKLEMALNGGLTPVEIEKLKIYIRYVVKELKTRLDDDEES